MALNLPNFLVNNFNAPGDIFNKRQQEHQDLMSAELGNIFKRITNEYEPERLKSNIAHTKAQTGHLGASTAGLNAELPYKAKMAEANARRGSAEATEQEIMTQVLQEAMREMQKAQQGGASSQGATSGMPGIMGQFAHSGTQPPAQDNSLMQNPLYAGILKKKFGIESPGPGEFEKAVLDAQKVKQIYGPNSQEARLADAWLDKKANGAPGMQLSVDPSTGAVSFTQGRQAGGQQIVDGKVLSPQTGQTTNRIQQMEIANVSRDFLANSAKQPFIGAGANKDIAEAWGRVKSGKGSSEDRENLINAAVAQKLIPERAMEQLKSQGIEGTRFNLKAQEAALTLGFPAALKGVVDNLPKDMQEEANKRHDEILAESARLKREHVAKGFPFEMQQQNEQSAPPNGNNVDPKQAQQTFQNVQSAMQAINSANPGQPFSLDDFAQTAAKYGMTIDEFAQYIMQQQGGNGG